jgi:hypothetical protein
MARRSGWQQFADNFNSVYKIGNKLQSDIETGKIMREEVEVVNDGLKNPHTNYQATYGGKTYDKEITADQLKGLRNERLINTMTKYGDIKGGMELQLKNANLKEKQRANALGEATLANDIKLSDNSVTSSNQSIDMNAIQLEQAKAEHQSYINTLDATEAALYAKTAGLQLDNDNKILSLSIANATKDDVIRASKLGVNAIELQNVNAMLVNSNLQIDIEGNLVDLNVKKATEGDKIASSAEALSGERLENARKILANIGLKIDNSGNLLDLEKSQALQAATIKKETLALDVETQTLQKQKDYNTVYESYAERAAIPEGQEGAFTSQKEANAFLLDGLNKIDPDLAMDLQRKYKTDEIANITLESTLLRKQALSALGTGGLEGLAKAIDDTNGVNNVSHDTDKKTGVITLTEVDPEGNDVRVIATGKDLTEFTVNLEMSLDPATMMASAKAYHDDNKTQAETEYYKQQTAGLKAGKPLTKDQWAIARLEKNPKDTFAWSLLLGDGYDMETIEAYAVDFNIDNKSGAVAGSSDAAASGSTSASTTGLVNNAGSSKVTKVQIDTSASQNEQDVQTAQAAAEISKRTKVMVNKIRPDIIPGTLDRNLPAKDLAEQKLRDTAKKWLKKNMRYFLTHPDQLASFEANPEKWVQENITTQGLSGKR